MSLKIDALRQRKGEIEAKIEPLIAANQALYDQATAAKRDLTVDEASTFDKNMEAIKAVRKDLDRVNALIAEAAAVMDSERNAGGKPVNGNGNGEDSRKNGFASMGEMMAAVARAGRGGRVDPRLSGKFGDFDDEGRFQASGGSDGSMNEAVPSEGGFLVNADYSDKIYQRSYLTGEITRRCQRQPISNNSNRLVLRIVDEDSRADGSRMGGILSYWQNEADQFVSSRTKFRRIELVLNKLTALLFATDELLEDVAALEAWIMQNLPTEIAFRTEDAIFQGTGVGQPAGIFKSAAFLALTPGATANVINGTDAIAMLSQFWYPGLRNLIPAYSSENLTAGAGPKIPSAAWFVSQSTFPQLFNLQQPQIAAGATSPVILLYHAPGDNPLYGPYGELMGLPVIPTEHNAALGTVGDIVLADLSQVLLADKGAVQAAASMHVRFLFDEMAFRFTYRVDAQTTWKKPLTPKDGGPNLSPFVGLASGANR
jgi:HK97 family phage major capsid protein